MLSWTLAISALCVAHAAEPDPVTAAPTGGPIEVDGVLDEPAWARATPIGDLRRYEPVDGGPPDGSTEIRVLYDDKALYIGVRVRDASYPIRANTAPREQINEDDQIGIYLDTFADARTGYIFYLNPLGIQQDIRFNGGSWNPYWNTLFYSEGRVEPSGRGYTLEIALPWRSLTYPGGGGDQIWTVSFTRKIPSEGARYAWPERERNHPRIMSQNAPLVVSPPRRGRRIDVIAGLTVVQAGARDELSEPLPLNGLSEPLDAIRPSIENARIGLSPDTALDLTLNPDFSQIEVDATPIDLNQRFAFEFDERRPFFLEGADLLEDRSDTLYSRSIVEPLYGVKLGSREGKVAAGLLHALDASPAASVNERGAPGFDAADVEGRTAMTSVMRLRLDAFRGGYMGFTLADKRLTGTESVHDAFGADFDIPLGERWTVAANTLRSSTRSDEREIIGEQNGVELSRASGEGTGLNLWVDDRTPGFRSEAGFVPQSGTRNAGGYLDYTLPFTGVINTWTPWASTWRNAARGASGEDLGDFQRAHELGSVLVFGGVHYLEVIGALTKTGDEGSEVDGYQIDAYYGATLSGGVDVELGVEGGRILDYSTLSEANVIAGGLELLLRPSSRVRLETEVEVESLQPAEDERRTASALRERVYLQFDEVHGIRLIAEYSAGSALSDRLISSILFTRLVHPGTALYVGYAETTALEGGVGALDRSVFAKATVLFRP